MREHLALHYFRGELDPADRDEGHALHAAHQHQRGLGEADLGAGDGRGLETARAHARQGHRGHVVRETGRERDRSGRVAALFRLGIGAAHHDLVHFLARPTGQPLEEAPEERGEKIVGKRPRQRALPGARERGAGRGADPGGFRGLRVGHGGAAPRRSVLTPAASTFRDPPCPGACAAVHPRGSPREGACRAPAGSRETT